MIHVFIIAHPDDESMFFLPTFFGLQQAMDETDSVWLVCLTTGNYDGLGNTRARELRRVCNEVLPMVDRLLLLDQEDIMVDHPTQRWDIPAVATALHEALEKALQETESIQFTAPKTASWTFYTFDKGGVSGHVNHTDTFLAVQHLIHHSNSLPNISQAWMLKSERNPLAKYIPIFSWMLLILYLLMIEKHPSYSKIIFPQGETKLLFRLHRPWINWKAMVAHQSQFVWYRRLFVIFSCYTYVNEWSEMPPTRSTLGKKVQ